MKAKAKIKKCEQQKCGFLQFGQGCRACAECKTEPFLVNDDCTTCWNCSHDEGILRWDFNKNFKDEQQTNKNEKEIVIES
jgi:hypothetical protein